MAISPGPFTKKMISKELYKIHPGLSRQEIMLDISCALQEDKRSKEPIFTRIKIGWWDLAQKEDPGT